MTDSNKVATNQDDDPNLFDLSNDPIATDDTIEKVKAFLVELQPKRFRTIEALVARIDTLTAEVTRLRGLCGDGHEQISRLWAMYLALGLKYSALIVDDPAIEDCDAKLDRASKGDI